MTKKVYKSAQGKIVDLGALMLQNEHVRAVGNMNVNARGDIVDSNNKVIESTPQRVQKSYQRQTNVSSSAQVVSGTRVARKLKSQVSPAPVVQEPRAQVQEEIIESEIESQQTAPEISDGVPPSGGLAAAIARAKTVKQELEPTLRERMKQNTGINKI